MDNRKSITALLSEHASVLVNDIGVRVQRLQSAHDALLAAVEFYAQGGADGGELATSMMCAVDNPRGGTVNLRQRARDLVLALRRGCGDSACVFAKPPSGMSTNGGCQCHETVEDALRDAMDAEVRRG